MPLPEEQIFRWIFEAQNKLQPGLRDAERSAAEATKNIANSVQAGANQIGEAEQRVAQSFDAISKHASQSAEAIAQQVPRAVEGSAEEASRIAVQQLSVEEAKAYRRFAEIGVSLEEVAKAYTDPTGEATKKLQARLDELQELSTGPLRKLQQTAVQTVLDFNKGGEAWQDLTMQLNTGVLRLRDVELQLTDAVAPLGPGWGTGALVNIKRALAAARQAGQPLEEYLPELGRTIYQPEKQPVGLAPVPIPDEGVPTGEPPWYSPLMTKMAMAAPLPWKVGAIPLGVAMDALTIPMRGLWALGKKILPALEGVGVEAWRKTAQVGAVLGVPGAGATSLGLRGVEAVRTRRVTREQATQALTAQAPRESSEQATQALASAVQSGVSSGLKGDLGGVAAAVGQAAEAGQAATGGWFKKLWSGVGGIKGILSAVLAKFGPLLLLGKLVWSAVGPALKALVNIIDVLAVPLQDALLDLVNFIRPFAYTLAPLLGQIARSFTKVLTPLLEIVGTLLISFVKLATPVMKSLASVLTLLLVPIQFLAQKIEGAAGEGGEEGKQRTWYQSVARGLFVGGSIALAALLAKDWKATLAAWFVSSKAADWLEGFQHGGIVPGPIGQPQLAVVHGGEVVVPTGETALASSKHFVFGESAPARVELDPQGLNTLGERIVDAIRGQTRSNVQAVYASRLDPDNFLLGADATHLRFARFESV